MIAFPEIVRTQIAARILEEREALHEVLGWFDHPVPHAMVDLVVAGLKKEPRAWRIPEIAPALLNCTPAQLAGLKASIDEAPETEKPPARRALALLTLLTRLDQELS